MLRLLSRLTLAALGWRFFEPSEPRPPKAVLIEYPHTSNWDAFYGLLTNFALGADIHWMAKDTAFRWPFGGIMKRLGGVPVNRRERTNVVTQMIEEFSRRERFVLGITPEGTRSRTEGWKSGFYRIACAANVPLAIGVIDFARKEAGIVAYLALTGDRERDLQRIAALYAGRAGKHPALASPIRWLD